MATPFYEDFRIEEDCWTNFGGSVSKLGVDLVVDATDSASVVHPWFMQTYSVANRTGYSGIDHSQGFYCMDHVVHVGDVVRFGLGVNTRMASIYPRCFEFYRVDAATHVISKRTLVSGFNGGQVSADDTVRLRFSMRVSSGSNPCFRLAVCTLAGAVVVDTGWLARTFFEVNAAVDWCDIVRNGSYDTNRSLQRIFPVPAWCVPTGSTTIEPGTGYMHATQAEAEEFLSTGVIAAVAAIPPTPTIAVTNHLSNVNKIVITCSNSSAYVFVTVDEGANQEPPHQNKRVICRQGSVEFVLRKPAVLRAVAVFETQVSDMLVEYVGDVSAVPVPEISPACDYVYADRPCQVNITCADNSALIRYTLDGSAVTAGSALYTGTLQIRDSRRLRVKAFNGASESLEKYGLYVLKIPAGISPLYRAWDLADSSSWSYSGNATFAANSLTVNDPTGLGVVLREDLLCSGPLVGSMRFRVSGPFRLKIPGTNEHLAWIGDNIGIVSDAQPTPATSFATQTHADVRITSYSTYDGAYYTTVTVRGNSVTVSFTSDTGIGPASIANYNAQAVGFSGAGGLSPFVVSDLETYVGALTDPGSLFTTNVQALPVLPVPTMTPATDNVVGATLAGVGTGTVTLTRNTSMTFGTIPGTESSPFSTDGLAGAEYAIAATQAGSIDNYALRYVHGSQIVTMLAAMDTKRSWGYHYALSESRATMLQYFQMNTQPTVMGVGGFYQSERRARTNGKDIREWSTLEFTHHRDVYDTGNAWYKAEIEVRCDGASTTRALTPAEFRIACNFHVPDAVNLPMLYITRDGGAPTYLWTDSKHHKTERVQLAQMSTREGTGDSVVVGTPRLLPRFITWLCGRRVHEGVLELRIVLKCDELLSEFAYDTGWIACGAPSALANHRPRVLVDVRDGNLSGVTVQLDKGLIRGYAGLTEAEVDNCFNFGAPTPLPTPTFTAGAVGTDGMQDLTVNAADADIVHVHLGDGALRERGESAGLRPVINRNEYRVAPGTVIQVPATSRVRAIALKTLNPLSIYERRSAVAETNLQPLTTEFLSISTTQPNKVLFSFIDPVVSHLYQQAGNISAYVDHTYNLVFSDGFEHRISVFGSANFERSMLPGVYTVKLVRVWMSSIDFYSRQGETQPVQFTVNASGSAVVVAPSAAVLDVAAAFTASVSGGLAPWVGSWTFSDDTELAGTSVNKTFTKPGRYTWEFRAADSSGELIVHTGSIVVPYIATTLDAMTKSAEVRVS